MSDIYKKINELNSKYGSDFEEDLVKHLKKKFPEQYKLSLEDLKNDGSDDPEMEMTPGRFADHIGDKGEEFLKEYEAILKKLNG
jgi:predicted HicB family RNase H-like nuclease